MTGVQQYSKKKDKPNFKIELAYWLLNRYALTLYNLLVIFIVALGVWDLGKSLLKDLSEVNEMSKVVCGAGSTIVSYGIVLEERKSLMSIFRCYPYYQNDDEKTVDRICTDYGIVLLVIGLFVEVTNEFFEIPNDVINTEGREPYLFATGCVFMAITIVHLLKFCYYLITLKKTATQQS